MYFTNLGWNYYFIVTLLLWAGRVAHMGEGRGVYRVLVGKP